jgi:Holliday junction resolvase RusA-like endonuclease
MLPFDEPPEHGTITFEVPAAPVSFQATATKKAAIVSAVRTVVSHCHYLLCGDLKLAIEWGISERARYETDSAADVDNIVKPILDALSGPDGIMIDDCQIQELTCYWSGGYANPAEERIKIEIRFEPDAFTTKKGLLFLNVEKGLYFPIHDDLPPRLVLQQAEILIERFSTARELRSEEHGDVLAHSSLPSQRVFHRSKLGSFNLTSFEDLRARLQPDS